MGLAELEFPPRKPVLGRKRLKPGTSQRENFPGKRLHTVPNTCHTTLLGEPEVQTVTDGSVVGRTTP